MKTQIIEKFIEYTAEHKKRPKSVAHFMRDTFGESENTFQKYFKSFDDLEQVIWEQQLAITIEQMKSEPVYYEYSVREKLLALYFTLFEVMKPSRNLAVYTLSVYNWWNNDYAVLNRFKVVFEHFANELLHEGLQTQELTERTLVTGQYDTILWWQMLFLLDYWKDDQSKDFESTDAAIEKSVNLLVDLLGENVIDSTFDFMKFIFQK